MNQTLPTTDPTDTTAPPRPPRARRHAVIGYKGGSLKTTCIQCTAESAAARGRNVLVIDTDPQANVTRRLRAHDTDRPTLADVLHPRQPVPITDAITVCGWPDVEWAPRIHVVQAPSMAHISTGCEQLEFRVQEAHLPGSEHRLRIAMKDIPDGHYDLVLIDTAPSMGHGLDLVLSALNNPGHGDGDGDRLWLGVNPTYDSIEGGLKFVRHVHTYRDNLSVPHLDIAGVIATNVRLSNPLHASVLDQMPDSFPGLVSPYVLPRHDRLEEVHHEALPVALYPELHRKRWPGKGAAPIPSFKESMDNMTGVIIDAK